VRRTAGVFLALGVVGGIVVAVFLHGGPAQARNAPPSPGGKPLVVGFLDDPNFRWRPYRGRMLDKAHATGARLIRAIVRWNVVAPERPAPGALPFDEPLMYELDDLVWQARIRGMEVLLTIWGTPAWANDGEPPNRPPTHARDLGRFAYALARRYPQVRRYAVWNEPNTEQFLTPQFDEEGRSVAPQAYARLYRAAYAGIKAGNPRALVAIGETSSHGLDAPSQGLIQDSHSPARFAELLSRVRPRVWFDAWAHHPYPTTATEAPDEPAAWPAVTMSSLERFGAALDTWFGESQIPLWLTEYAYETTPADPLGVTPELQAEYAERALTLAAEVPRVQLFVWFTFRDDYTNHWQSGLLDRRGRPRPIYARFTAATRSVAS
jgi:cellulase (glycosyl hydrolase family 5)